jgi:hypothetical protein
MLENNNLSKEYDLNVNNFIPIFKFTFQIITFLNMSS